MKRLLFLFVLLCLAAPAWATDANINTWTGAVDGNWNQAANWIAGRVPCATDVAVLLNWCGDANFPSTKCVHGIPVGATVAGLSLTGASDGNEALLDWSRLTVTGSFVCKGRSFDMRDLGGWDGNVYLLGLGIGSQTSDPNYVLRDVPTGKSGVVTLVASGVGDGPHIAGTVAKGSPVFTITGGSTNVYLDANLGGTLVLNGGINEIDAAGDMSAVTDIEVLAETGFLAGNYSNANLVVNCYNWIEAYGGPLTFNGSLYYRFNSLDNSTLASIGNVTINKFYLLQTTVEGTFSATTGNTLTISHLYPGNPAQTFGVQTDGSAGTVVNVTVDMSKMPRGGDILHL
jgi:hypothetical protein